MVKRSAVFFVLLAPCLQACDCGRVTQPTTAGFVATHTELDFGEVPVGQTRHVSLGLSNTGRTALELVFAASGPFSASPQRLGLGAGDTVETVLAFSPTQLGDEQREMEISAAGASPVKLTLRGRGVAACASTGPCRVSRWDEALPGCVDEAQSDQTPCSSRCAPAGTCWKGACFVGQLDPCEDADRCTLDACSEARGCLHLPVECPAGPCTAAYCSREVGCSTVPVTDGTPCGPSSCATANICLSGVCALRSVPNAASDCLYTDLTVSSAQACGLTRGGGVRCWSPTTAPEYFNGLRSDVLTLSGGGGAFGGVCASSAQSASCDSAWWGLDGGPVDLFAGDCWTRGALLECTARRLSDAGSVAVTLDGGGPWRALSSNADTACAVDASGLVRCWGSGFLGILGFQQVSTHPFTLPVVVPLPGPARTVSISQIAACAVLDSGAVWCWGQGLEGPPDVVPRLLWDGDFIDVSVAYHHPSTGPSLGFVGDRACALRADGGVRCSLVEEDGLAAPGAVKLRLAKDWGGCLLLQSGEIQCWGRMLAEPAGPEGVTTLLRGGATHLDVRSGVVLVSLRDGGAVATGRLTGELAWVLDGGLRFATGQTRTVELPPGAAPARSLVLDNVGERALGHFSDGSLWASAQGTPWRLDQPTVDAGVVAFNRSSWFPHGSFCHALESGQVWCWNLDVSGASYRPEQVLSAGAPVRSLHTSSSAVCGRVDGGLLRCAGTGPDVRLLDGGPAPILDLCGSSGLTCVLTASGTPSCALRNSPLDLDPAQPLPGVWPGTSAIACDASHVCTVSGGGGVQCWGPDLFAPDPWTAPWVSAAPIPLGEAAVQVATDGHQMACALLSSGSVKCWGVNFLGARGAQRLESSATPITITR